MANLLSHKGYPGDCTVTVCHSRTKNIPEITRTADILIVAMGQPEFVTAEMVKEGVVVIDVGITRVKSCLLYTSYLSIETNLMASSSQP